MRLLAQSKSAHETDGAPFELLVHTIQAHAESETESIETYRRLAAQSPDTAVAMLLQLIIDDEERHHRVLHGIARMLRDDLDRSKTPCAVPEGRAEVVVVSTEMAEAIRAAMEDERQATRRFRTLARRQAASQEGIITLLLERLAMDSQKHQCILAFIARRLKADEQNRG
jgi:rubrerythrin